MVNTQTSTEARSRLAEIQARQRQALQAACHSPRWYLFSLAVLVAVFYLATWRLQGTWVTVALTVAYLAAIGGLTMLQTRRAPVQVHPSRFVRPRVWLASLASGLVIGGIVMVVGSLTPEGLPSALVLAGTLLLVMPVLHRVSHRWTLRREPASAKDPGGRSTDDAEAEWVAR